MAGYIGTQAVSVNTTSATISDDLAVGDDATIAGDLDVDGTTNLDVVDIDGAVNMATTALVTGVLTTTAATVFNGGFGSSKASNVIAADGAAANAFAMQIHNLEATANQSFGLYIQAGSGSDQALKISDHDAANDLFTLTGAGVATIKNGLTLTDGNLVVAAGHGVDFSAQTATSVTGASATAELLDHYEEGTWTPTVAGLTLSSVSAHYTRIGDMVHFGFTITMPSTSATTHMKITGVPFSITTDEFGASLTFTTSAVVNSLIIGVANSNDLQFYAPESAFATYANFSQKIVRASGSFKTDTA